MNQNQNQDPIPSSASVPNDDKLSVDIAWLLSPTRQESPFTVVKASGEPVMRLDVVREEGGDSQPEGGSRRLEVHDVSVAGAPIACIGPLCSVEGSKDVSMTVTGADGKIYGILERYGDGFRIMQRSQVMMSIDRYPPHIMASNSAAGDPLVLAMRGGSINNSHSGAASSVVFAVGKGAEIVVSVASMVAILLGSKDLVWRLGKS